MIVKKKNIMKLRKVYNASAVIVLELIPIIILFIFLGYGLKNMGFVLNNLSLILALVVVTIILGLPSEILFNMSHIPSYLATGKYLSSYTLKL